MAPRARRKRTVIRVFALAAAPVLAALVALFISGAVSRDSPDKEFPEIRKRLLATVRNAPSKEIAWDRANQLLASVDNPRTVRLLAYTCSDTASELCNTDIEDDYEQGEKLSYAWEGCVVRLIELGQAGDGRGAAELWRMQKSGRYDAGAGESVITAISEIGRPALPMLRRKRLLGSSLARDLIKAIESGEILE